MATSQPADGGAVSSRTPGGPDLRPPALSFCDMLAHAGHKLTVRVYKARGVAMETALVCKTCGRELRTATNPVANHNLHIRASAL